MRQLHAAFVARNRETWVDWEGIEPSDAWLRSILEAIDASDAVVVVLSPDWLESEICKVEAEHAASANKRLIPVVVRDIEAVRAAVPEAIASLNWIFARPGRDDLEQAADAIVVALDTDLESVRTHTLVLTRARAWELAGRRRSPLLRGEELGRAEEWVARAAAGTKPQPTGLQAAFVEASREAARRRTRAAVSGSLTIAAVAIGLAIFAFISRAQAIHESHVAVSHELAADSSTVLGSDPELSLLLARQALVTDANSSAKLAVVTALDDTTVRAILHFGGVHGGVIADSWSPTAELVALAGQNGSIGLWDPLSNELVRTFKADDHAVDAVAFSPDGRLLASGGGDERVEVWDVASGRLLHSFKGSRGLIVALAWSPDGRYLISGAYDGMARIWSLAANAQVGEVQDERGRAQGRVVSVAFSPTGSFFVTANSVDGYTVVWRFELPRPRPEAYYRPSLVYQAPNGMALSPDGDQIAMAGGDGNLRLWNWTVSRKVTVLHASTDPLLTAAYNRTGTLVAAAGLDGDARVWTTGGQLLQRNPGDRGLVDGLAFSPDGRWLATAGADGTARLWTVRSGSGAQLGVRAFGGGLHELISGAVSPSGSLVVDADGTGTLHAWRLLGGAQLWQRLVGAGDGRCSCELSFDASGGRIAVGESSGVAVLRASDGAPIARLDGPDSYSVALSPAGTAVAAGGSDNRVRIWTLGGKGPPITVGMSAVEGNPESLAFSPDGKLLAVGLESGAVLLLDASTGANAGSLAGPAGSVLSLAFTPDGRFLAGASSDLRVWLWNLAERRPVRYFEGHTGPVDAVAISPNGELIAGGSDDDTAIVWDLRSAEELRVLSGDTDMVTSAGFSPDGEDVITTSSDGTLRTWDSCSWCESVPELMAHAAPAIARCFTADELAIYLHKPNAQNEPCSA